MAAAMNTVGTDAGAIRWREDGAGAPVLFINALGSDHRIWDRVVGLLPAGVRALRYDKRGHGASEVRGRDWGMGDHVADAAAVMRAAGASDAVVVGLSIGGQIAQGLAAERPELVRGLVLCATAAKIGAPGIWDDRIAEIEAQGIETIADAVMARWFTRRFLRERPDEVARWRAALAGTPLDGYLGSCAAIRDTDLQESTSRLRIPTLALCGDQDGSIPPDMMRETAALIPGAAFRLIRGAGHMPCIEQPEAVAAEIGGFLRATGHI